jgi:WD40 repeat protein
MTRPLAYQGDVMDLTFSHNERFLAVAERAGGVRIFDPAQGREIAFLQVTLAPQAELKYPRFSPDDSLLAVVGTDELRFIRTSDWTLLPARSLKPSKAGGGAMSLFFTPDGGNLLVADQELVREVCRLCGDNAVQLEARAQHP